MISYKGAICREEIICEKILRYLPAHLFGADAVGFNAASYLCVRSGLASLFRGRRRFQHDIFDRRPPKMTSIFGDPEPARRGFVSAVRSRRVCARLRLVQTLGTPRYIFHGVPENIYVFGAKGTCRGFLYNFYCITQLRGSRIFAKPL